MNSPIGVFDSGFGGLTVLKELHELMPENDYLYLGDNARAPYGNRSFDTVYEYTLEAVEFLFQQGCELVILACNTASAKALRTIQQKYLSEKYPNKRVLGVIRPTTELVGSLSKTGHVGILGTIGTVQSNSYVVEIAKFSPQTIVSQEACPMWVPLIENNLMHTDGAAYFIKENLTELLSKDAKIDTLVLACTHYPLLSKQIQDFLPTTITVLSQGEIVANSLQAYLNRHPEIADKISKTGNCSFLTTDDTSKFDEMGTLFFGKKIKSEHCRIDK
jgi:glutamate racemase